MSRSSVRDRINVVGDVHDPVSLGEIWERDSYRCAGRVRPGSVVVDVGANVGTFTLWAAAAGAHVIAVEPLPENLDQLRRNIAATGLGERVAAMRAAVGATDGECAVSRGGATDRPPDWSTGAWTGPGVGCVVVSFATIMSAVLGDVDVLKVDCEGGEYPLFSTARREHLARVRFIAMEFHVWRRPTDPPDPLVGTRDAPFPVGAVDRLVAKLDETHEVTVAGRRDVGGYLFGERR